jgi:hypothetical protein
MSSLLGKANQLHLDRENEGIIELNESDIQVLGYYAEPLNPNKRLILLVTLKTPYLDLLGNLQYKLPFYRSSGKYSGQKKKDNFQPFFGVMSNLKLQGNKKANLGYLKSLIKGVEISPEIENQLMLSEWMIKCSYFTEINNLVNRQVFNSHQMNWRNVFGTAFTIYPGFESRICNEYLKKYADALMSFSTRNSLYFINQPKRADLSSLDINRMIGDNSIFGFNINNAIFWADSKNPVRSDIDTLVVSLKSNIKKTFPETMYDDNTMVKDHLLTVVDFLNEGSDLPTESNIIDYLKDWYDLQQTGVGKKLRDFLKCLSGPESEKCDAKSEAGEIKQTDDTRPDADDVVVQAHGKMARKNTALFNEYIKDDPNNLFDLAGGRKKPKRKKTKTKKTKRKKTKRKKTKRKRKKRRKTRRR